MLEEHQNKKIFAKGFSFTKIFVFFLLGSMFGYLFEGITALITKGEWANRRDLIYGPFSTLYGLGIIINLIILIPKSKKRSIIKTFLYSCLIGGSYEYLMGFLSELLFDIKFWDYSNKLLNINGKTTVPIMIAGGIFGTILVKLIYPLLSKQIEKIPYKIGQPIFIVLLIFIIFNMVISYSAFGRMVLRNKNEEPITIIGKYIDTKYDDAFMYKKFPILKNKL